MRKISILLLTYILLSCLTLNIYAAMSADDKKTARKIWLKGFDNYGKGKTSRDDGRYKESLRQFQNALKLFEKVKKLYPDWNKDLIDYRINVCRAKLVEVKADMQKTNLEGSQMELDMENLHLKQKVKDLQKELKDVKNQLDITFASLDVARRESSRNDKVIKQVNDLLREKIKLTNKCAMLRSQLSQLKKRKDSTSSSPEKAEELQEALIQLDTIKRDRKELISTIEVQKKKLKTIIDERNKLSLKLQDFQNKHNSEKQKENTFQKEIKTLRENALSFKKEKEELDLKLSALRKKQAEKEIMIEQLKLDLEKSRSSSPASENVAVDKLTKDKELLLLSLENANEKIASQNREIKALNEKSVKAANKITTLSNALAGIDTSRSGLESDMKIITKKLIQAQKKIKDQETRLKKQGIEYKNLKKDFELYSKTVRNTDTEMDASSTIIQKLADSHKEKEELKSELDAANGDYLQLQKKLESVKDKLKEANKTIEASNAEIKALENRPDGLNAYPNNEGMDALKEKNGKLTVELDALKITNSELLTKVNSLTDKVDKLNLSIEQKQKLLDKAQTLCEAKLKENASNTPASPNESQEYIALLNENDHLKALAQEQKIEISGQRKKLVGLKSDLKKKQEEINNLRKKSDGKNDLTKNPAYLKLLDEKKAIQDNLNKKITENATLMEKLENLNKQIGIKDKSIRELRTSLAKKEKVNVKETPEYSALIGKNKVLSRILEGQKDKIVKLQKQIVDIQDKLDGEKLKLQKISGNKSKNIEDNKKYKNLLAQQEQLQLSLTSKNSEIKNIKETLDELKNELKSKETQIAALREKDATGIDVKNTAEYIALMNENDQLQTMLEDKTKEINSFKANVEDLEKENTELMGIKHSYETEKEKTETKKAEKAKEDEEIGKLIEAAADAENEGKTDAAIWYYETILEQDHENSTALAKLGLIIAAKRNFKEAEPLLQKSLAKSYDNLEALLALTFCHINNKHYYKALSSAALANSVNSNNPIVHRYLGIICSYLGWYDVAETEFRTAFRINPKSGETAYNAAVNLVKADLSKLKIAKQWYDKSIELGVKQDIVLEKLFTKKLQELKNAEKNKKTHFKHENKHEPSKKSM